MMVNPEIATPVKNRMVTNMTYDVENALRTPNIKVAR